VRNPVLFGGRVGLGHIAARESSNLAAARQVETWHEAAHGVQTESDNSKADHRGRLLPGRYVTLPKRLCLTNFTNGVCYRVAIAPTND